MDEIEVALPNGSVIVFPAGTDPAKIREVARKASVAPPEIATRGPDSNLAVAPGTTPEMASRIPEGMVYDPATGGYFDAAAQAERGGTAGGVATKFLQGAPFVGQYADEAAGAIDSALGASSPELAQETVRQAQERFDRTNPKTATAAQLAGGVVGSLPAASLAGPAAAVMPVSRGGQVAATAAAGGVTGALEGAASRYGANNDQPRADGIGGAAVVGGALGAVVGAAAPLAAEGIRAGLRRLLGKSDVATIAAELGISQDAAKVIRNTLDGDDLGQAADNIDRAGPNAMIADGGVGTRQMLKTVTATPGPAQRVAREAVDARADQAAGQLRGALDQTMGAPSGRIDAAESVRRASAPVRNKAYEAAYSQPIDYASPQGRAIEDTLSRIPPARMQAAIRSANEEMTFRGVRNNQIMAQIADDGTVTFTTPPNAQQLDYIKREFDKLAEAGKDPLTGKLSPEARFAQEIAREVKLRHAAANPEYRTALRTAGDSIQLENAIETGYKALSPNMTREVLARELRGASRPQREAAATGARQYIDDQMAAARQVFSDPGRSEDIAGAVKALNDMSSPRAKQNLRIILGSSQADKLFEQIDEVRTAFTLRAAIAKGSETAVNTATREAIDTVARPNAVDALFGGNIKDATRQSIQFFTGTSDEMAQLRREGVYADIARALTEKRGPLAADALRVVERAMAGQQVNAGQATIVARALTAGAGGLAYQEGSRRLQARPR